MLNNNDGLLRGKEYKQQQQEQQRQSLANNPAGSICCSNCCYRYPSVLWDILFLFLSTLNLQFAVISKKASGSQGKESVEHRGSSLANAKEFSLQNQKKEKILLSKSARYDTQLLKLDKKYFL
jgi:hypothetical protein